MMTSRQFCDRILEDIRDSEKESLITFGDKTFSIDKEVLDEFFLKVKKTANGGNTSKVVNEIIKDWLVQPDYIIEDQNAE